MDTRSRGKLAAYLKLLSRYRGEAVGAYDELDDGSNGGQVLHGHR